LTKENDCTTSDEDEKKKNVLEIINYSSASWLSTKMKDM
jgi:hypothetical protein